ncbi:response regulator [Teichococcus deserti]|uniref:response regulator n=1 Tax=Teichococcus deserti TaxID=1817963 RepID=UPI001A958ACC|nr:response regulator [Pseudoroseomonas deserti]
MSNRRILIVEDEFLLAEELAEGLMQAGATILGPVPTIAGAFNLIARQGAPSGAVLDVNLSGVAVYPLADALIELGIPLVFTTGYDPGALPRRFATVPRCDKPFNLPVVVTTMAAALDNTAG